MQTKTPKADRALFELAANIYIDIIVICAKNFPEISSEAAHQLARESIRLALAYMETFQREFLDKKSKQFDF